MDAAVLATVREHRASLRHPPMTAAGLLDCHLKQGRAATVNALRQHAEVT